MRVTSAFFVAALLRRSFGAGAFGAIMRRGAEEAGAVFVIVDRLDGTLDLYGPAPQSAFDDRPTGRLFQRLIGGGLAEEVTLRLSRETKFDPDLWVVAIEDRAGRCFLDLAPG